MKIDRRTFDDRVRFYETGDLIFREEEEGSEMFVIIQGSVEIRKATGSGSTKTLTTLHKGDLFGEMAIIEKKPRSASAVAVEPTKLLVLNTKLYDSLVTSNPDFARKMNRLLSERIRKANAIIQHLMTTNRQNQLWAGLQEFARQHGVSTFKGNRVKVDAFQEWASEHLGLAARDVEGLLAIMLRKEIISYSAKGREEILVDVRNGAAPPG